MQLDRTSETEITNPLQPVSTTSELKGFNRIPPVLYLNIGRYLENEDLADFTWVGKDHKPALMGLMQERGDSLQLVMLGKQFVDPEGISDKNLVRLRKLMDKLRQQKMNGGPLKAYTYLLPLLQNAHILRLYNGLGMQPGVIWTFIATFLNNGEMNNLLQASLQSQEILQAILDKKCYESVIPEIKDEKFTRSEYANFGFGQFNEMSSGKSVSQIKTSKLHIIKFIKFLNQYGPDSRETVLNYLLLSIAEAGAMHLLPLVLAYPALCYNFSCHYLKSNADISGTMSTRVKSAHGCSALGLAVFQGQIPLVSALLSEKYVNPNHPDALGYTPLALAIIKGYVEIVDMLLKHPAINVNGQGYETTEEKHFTSILDAICVHIRGAKNKERLKALEIYFADPRVNPYQADETAINHVVRLSTEVKKSIDLTRMRFSIAGSSQTGKSLMKLIKEGRVDSIISLHCSAEAVNYADEKGRTPLMLAVTKGDPKLIAHLLTIPGINVNQCDRLGNTALCYAALTSTAVMEPLLQHPDINPNCWDNKGLTPLLRVISHETRSNLLLKHPRINIHVYTPKGDNLLMMAIEKKANINIITLLISMGADIYHEISYGYTALFIAINRGNIAVVKLLLEKLPHLDHEDKYSRNALMYALSRRKTGEVEHELEAIILALREKQTALNSKKDKWYKSYLSSLNIPTFHPRKQVKEKTGDKEQKLSMTT